jgi:hypothetical protein
VANRQILKAKVIADRKPALFNTLSRNLPSSDLHLGISNLRSYASQIASVGAKLSEESQVNLQLEGIEDDGPKVSKEVIEVLTRTAKTGKMDQFVSISSLKDSQFPMQ